MQSRICVASFLFCLSTLACAGCGSDNTAPAATESGQPAAAESGASGKSSATKPKPAADPLHPQVTIATSHGDITVELDAENAPGTVYNFMNYVNSSHYDETLFHQVDPGKMILGGSFATTRERKTVGPPIRNEAHNGLKNQRGAIAMSRHYEAIDSATCQFFINVADNSDLNHAEGTPEGYGYCVFGKVVAGMDVVDKIAGAEVHDAGELLSTPREQVVINSIRTLR